MVRNKTLTFPSSKIKKKKGVNHFSKARSNRAKRLLLKGTVPNEQKHANDKKGRSDGKLAVATERDAIIPTPVIYGP